MSIPATHNFPDHYQNDGLKAFKITLKYASGNAVDLTGATVVMQLKNSLGTVGWEFSTRNQGNTKIEVLPGGIIQFPAINTWSIPSSKFTYDLEVTQPDGFVTTYLQGSWKIVSDTSRSV